MKELQAPLGRYNGLAWMASFMHLSFNTSPTNTIFGKRNILKSEYVATGV
jgi:hypothetical protein